MLKWMIIFFSAFCVSDRPDEELIIPDALSPPRPSVPERRKRGRPPKNSTQKAASEPSVPKRRRDQSNLPSCPSRTSSSTTIEQTASSVSRRIQSSTRAQSSNDTASSTIIASNDDANGEESDSEVQAAIHKEQQQQAKQSFRINTFNVVLDCLLSQISTRFAASKSIADKFSFLCDFSLDLGLAENAARELVSFYHEDLSLDFEQQFRLLRRSMSILLQPEAGNGNSSSFIPPLDLLNAIYRLELNNLIPEICNALRIFLFFVSSAEGERTFNVFSDVKDDHRTTMTQDRLNALLILSIERRIARTIDFTEIIDEFAKKAARRVNFI
jgi:hypothetical protein